MHFREKLCVQIYLSLVKILQRTPEYPQKNIICDEDPPEAGWGLEPQNRAPDIAVILL